MLWTFEKEGEKRVVEIRSSGDGRGFELRRLDTDGREVIEKFDTAEELRRRMTNVETELLKDGWSLAGTKRL